MNIAVTTALPLPSPRVPIHIRAGTPDDIPFMDGLQKKTTKQVGWMPTKQFEGKVALGHVLVAQEESTGERVGYLVGNDQYFKRDDVGIVYQVNVVEAYRRSFVGAALLKAQFERSAYGCKLYCCWCAQDIAANRFWESMGFVPLAYRAGGEARGKRQVARVNAGPTSPLASCPLPLASHRVHIFWQKRIRAGDDSTPWWYPAKTDGGAIREDRIILPIPPGVRWSDELPLLLPTAPVELAQGAKRSKKVVVPEPVKVVRTPALFGLPGKVFAPPTPKVEQPTPAPVVEKPKRTKRKADPALVAKSRELRDRYLEQVNAQPMLIAGKYDVARTIDASRQVEFVAPTKALAA
jgi:hypothetical protein